MDMRAPSSPAFPATQARGPVSVCGHLGEIVQGKWQGELALVTLPCDQVRVTARFAPGASNSALVARMAARLGPVHDSMIDVSTNVPAGCGAGISTASALASLRLMSPGLTPEVESAHLLAVEGAVDPLAFPASPPRIWASRRAVTLAVLPAFPELIAVGGFDGPGHRTNPDDHDFPDMTEAFTLLHTPTPQSIGRAASLSASANQSRNPRPNWAAAQRLMAETGALGIAVAHTGSALSLLFTPKADGISRAEAGLHALGLSHVMRVAFGGPGPMLAGDE